MNKKIENEVFSIIHKYKNEYDAGIKDSHSGDTHCDFVERFAREMIDLVNDYAEHELFKGFEKGRNYDTYRTR